MFAHYKPVESAPQLPFGNYKARIVKVEKKTVESKGIEYLKLTFEIDGHLGAKPDTATMFDEPKEQKFLESYNRDLTLFFDAFGIRRGEFNTNEWIGHEGEVTVYPKADNSGYNDISYFPLTEKRLQNKIKKAEEAEAEAKKNASNFANGGTQPPIVVGVPVTGYPLPPAQPEQPTLDNFPEDVPM